MRIRPASDPTITDFRFTLANKAALQMLGLPAEVLHTTTIGALAPPLGGREAVNRESGARLESGRLPTVWGLPLICTS